MTTLKFDIFGNMEPNTLAEICAAYHVMKDITQADFEIASRAETALIQNQGEEKALEMIEEAVNART